MKTLLQTFGLLTLVVGFYQPLSAAVLITGEANTTGYTVLTDDLLQTSVGSIDTVGAAQGGDGGADNAIGWAPLNDGVFGPTGSQPLYRASPNNGQSITFNLDLSTNTAGYNISQIDTYGAWGDPGRDRQDYELYFATVSAPTTFTLYATVSFELDPGSNPVNNHVNLIDDSFGDLATGVSSIRFVFNNQEDGFVGYREFDITGTPAAVPEPSTYALLAVGFGFLIWLRRKQVA